jgi:murein DD-endopeptidase MepM/ murein hydrolase activator NlpD
VEKIVMLLTRLVHILVVLLLAVSLPVPAQALDLQWPLSCTLGTDCWIQQYADHDSGPGASDYLCGTATYDGHDGTDIRVRDTSVTVPVVAAAAGIVAGGRDGMADVLLQKPEDQAAIANRECGNGVVINHGEGWVTQYCHMKQGSVIVKKGDKVSAGQKLGEVGFSGAAAFPHMHLSLRLNDQKIDPFSGAMKNACDAPDTSIWSPQAKEQLKHKDARLLRLGFAQGRVELPDLENGKLADSAPQADWPAIVAYAWVINLKKDDTLTITITGPDGVTKTNSTTLDRSKAQYLLFAGVKKPESGWVKGDYVSSTEVKTADGTRTLVEHKVMKVE